MTQGKIVTAFGLLALLVATPSLVEAQGRGGGGRVPPAGGGSGRVPSGATGRAVPRQGPPPHPGGGPYGGGGYGYGYRPYYSPYYYHPYYYSPYYYGAFAPGFSVGLAFGFGYGSVGFGYSGYYGPYGYGAYGYPYGYGYGGYPYGNVYGAPYAGYSYGYGQPYGGIRIDLPQRDAEVWADGYFAGTVDNFDGSMQQLSLTPGPHRIEVRQNGFEPVSFEVNVEPGRTVTYKTMLRPNP